MYVTINQQTQNLTPEQKDQVKKAFEQNKVFHTMKVEQIGNGWFWRIRMTLILPFSFENSRFISEVIYSGYRKTQKGAKKRAYRGMRWIMQRKIQNQTKGKELKNSIYLQAS